MDPAPIENAGVDGPNGGLAPPKPDPGVLGVPKERLLLPTGPAPGAGVLCPKEGVGVPPNTGLLSGVPGTAKANGALWFWAPSVFCVREEPKGVAVLADPFCPAPKLNATEGVPPLRADAPMAKALAPVLCWLDAPKGNGEGVVPPNTMLPAPLFVGWVLEPKLDAVEVVAVPKENTDVVPPKAGWELLVPKETWVLVPPKTGCELFPNAGCATEAPKPKAGVLKLAGPAAGLLVGCWLSGVPVANAG